MSVMNRLMRAFDSMSRIEMEGKDRGGIWGEKYSERVIQDGDYKDTAGRRQSIPYQHIQEVRLRRDGRFSAYDDLSIIYTIGGGDSKTREEAVTESSFQRTLDTEHRHWSDSCCN